MIHQSQRGKQIEVQYSCVRTLESADFWSSLQPLMEMARPPLVPFGFWG
jgi:hypothetical protein